MHVHLTLSLKRSAACLALLGSLCVSNMALADTPPLPVLEPTSLGLGNWEEPSPTIPDRDLASIRRRGYLGSALTFGVAALGAGAAFLVPNQNIAGGLFVFSVSEAAVGSVLVPGLTAHRRALALGYESDVGYAMQGSGVGGSVGFIVGAVMGGMVAPALLPSNGGFGIIVLGGAVGSLVLSPIGSSLGVGYRYRKGGPLSVSVLPTLVPRGDGASSPGLAFSGTF